MIFEIGDTERRKKRVAFLRLTLLISISILTLIAVILPIILDSNAYTLKVGDVSPRSIEAPYAHSYQSKVLTDEAIEKSQLAINPIYLPADPAISRNQLEKLRLSNAYISSVRVDSYASQEQKLEDISKLPDINLDSSTANTILEMTDSRWEAIQQESMSILEQVMRNSIRDTQVAEARRSLATLVSYSLTPEQAEIVINLVNPFIVPNSLYSEELTNSARKKAADTVSPINRSYISGEMIIQRGQIITPDIEEALFQFGIIRTNPVADRIWASISITLISSVFVAIYFSRRKISPNFNIISLLLISVFFLLFLFAGRLLLPGHTVLPYFFPVAAFGLTIAGLFTIELGLIFSLVLGITLAFGMPFGLDLTLFYSIASMCGILVLGSGRRVTSFIWAGLTIGFVGSAILIAYRLIESSTDLIGITSLVVAIFLSGIASASLALLLQYVLTQIFGLATPLHLLELTRSDHPLQQYILQNAPGTYQHSLQVANMAEQAAKSIGADPLLVRAGALYHDAGKATNPHFFIENQVGNQENPHNNISPLESSRIIVQHVIDGMALAKKYRLPPRVRNFITEHHGTTITRFQYNKACELAQANCENVEIEDYRYPGPRPQSRETALLMLADCAEAKARADLPKDETQLRAVIRKAIDISLQQGQLDDTNMTFLDLNRTIESFVFTLQNTYHPRIRYPEVDNDTHPLSIERGANES